MNLSHAVRLPITTWLPAWRREWLRADVVAGVSVAAVALPIAIAYSQLAGVPPVHGLYASLLPLVAYALLGSSRQLIVAPDAATCAIVAAVVAPLAGQLSGDLEAEGVTMAVAGAKSPVRTMLDRTGLTERIGTGRMFPTVASAVDALSRASTEK